jgi:hypothetical protein
MKPSRSLQWETNVPTIPGYYWLKPADRALGTGPQGSCVRELFKYNGLLVVETGAGLHTALADVAPNWAGPILEPAAPWFS